MATKKAIVKELYDQGITSPKEIAQKTGFNYGLVAVYVYAARHPDKFKQEHAKSDKKWQANNPKKVYQKRMKQYHSHQKRTKALANKHRQEWPLRDIEYLKIHAHEQSDKQIALYLG